MVKFNEWKPGDPPIHLAEYYGYTNIEVVLIATAALVLGMIIGYII
jgi:hypothetical protein